MRITGSTISILLSLAIILSAIGFVPSTVSAADIPLVRTGTVPGESGQSDEANPFVQDDLARAARNQSARADQALAAAPGQNGQSADVNPGEQADAPAPKTYVIRFKADCPLQTMSDLLADEDYRLIGYSDNRLARLTTADLEAFKLKAYDYLEYAEENQVCYSLRSANDYYFGDQWALDALNTQAAWDITTGSPTVLIAVIDSGIMRDHPDLNDADIRNGWDYLAGDICRYDFFGHGTEVTGVIAAETNNGDGISGLCWNAAVIPYLVLNNEGVGSSIDITSAIYDAADNGCKVINLSLGGPSYSAAQNEAIQYAYGKGCIVVAASGNNSGSSYSYPASYDHVISVGSINSSLIKSDFSQYNDRVLVCAPGEDIITTSLDGYNMVCGTSFSSPYVAGIAALAVSMNPNLTYDGFLKLIQLSSTDLGTPGYDPQYGYGLIDIEKMLTITPASVTGLKAVSTGSTSARLTWTPVGNAEGYSIYRSTSATGSYSAVAATTSNTYTNTGLTKGRTYFYKVKAYISVGTNKIYSAPSPYVSCRIQPSPPANFKATAASSGNISLTWTAVSGASGYGVFRSATSGGTYTLVKNVTSPGYSDTGLTAGSKYYYKVKSYWAVGSDKIYSAATLSANAQTPPVLKAVSASSSSYTLSWSASAGAAGYALFTSSTANGTYTYFKTVTSASVTLTGLSADSAHYYKVKAYTMSGSVKVYGVSSMSAGGYTRLDAPTGLTATGADGSVNLSWNAAAGAAGYAVYWSSAAAGTYTKIGTTSSLNYSNPISTPAEPGFYKVKAYRIVTDSKTYSAGSIYTGVVV